MFNGDLLNKPKRSKGTMKQAMPMSIKMSKDADEPEEERARTTVSR